MRDLFEREFPGHGTLDPDYLKKSGPKVPYNPEVPKDEESKKSFEEESKRLEEMRNFMQEVENNTADILNVLQPLIERDQEHVQTVIEKKKELEDPTRTAPIDRRPTFADLNKGSSDYSTVLGNMQSDMERSEQNIGRFTAAALHKGSLYTHDIHMFQQQVMTNRLLLALVNQGSKGKPETIDHVPMVDPITNEWRIISSDSKALINALGKISHEYMVNTGGKHAPLALPRQVNPMEGMPPIFIANPIMAPTPPPTPASTPIPHSSGTTPSTPGESKATSSKHKSSSDGHGHGEEGGNQRTRLRDLALVHGGDSGFVGPLDQLMWKFQHFRGRAMADAVKKLSGGLVGVSAFTPMALDIAGTVQYQQQIRQIAFQTEGITKEMSVQQDLFMARNEILDAAYGTGQKLADVEKAYVRNLQSGYKTAKDTLKVTRASLSVATQIGTGAEETAAAFHDMYMTLNLSAHQMDQIARGVANTARDSKMTGENLLKAVQSAKPLMDSMKKVGTLTSAASTGAIQMTAEFQKLGISDAMAPLMKSLTSISGWLNSDDKTRSLAGVLTGGNPTRFQGGKAFKDKALQRDMANNADEFMRMFGFDSKTIDKASTRQKENANQASEQVLGIGINDLAQAAQTFRKASMTLSEKVVDIDKQIANTATGDTVNRAALIAQKEGMRQESRLTIATNLAELMAKSPGKSVVDALASSRGEDLAPMVDDLRQLITADKFRFEKAGVTEGSLSSPEGIQQVLSVTYKDAIEQMNSQLKSNGSIIDDNFIINDVNKTLQEAMEDKSGAKMTSLLDRLNQGQQAAAKRDLKNTDPVVAALDSLNTLNAEISTGIGKSVTLLTGILGEVGILSLAFGAMSADAVVAFGGMFRHGHGGRAAARASRAARYGAIGTGGVQFGNGQLVDSLSRMPHNFRRRRQHAQAKMNRFGRNLVNEAGSLASIIAPGGPAPFRFVGGAARGFKSGIGGFGRSLGNFAAQVPAMPFKALKSIGLVSPLNDFFAKKLPNLVQSAFDPKAMGKRVMAGFDYSIGNRGPLKLLKNDFMNFFSIPSLGREGGMGGKAVGAMGEYFRNSESLAGKSVGKVRSAGRYVRDNVNLAATALMNTKTAQGVMGKAGSMKAGVTGAAGSLGRFALGKMSAGEAVFRAAAAQEKIPVWGKFASMFGATAGIQQSSIGLMGMSGTMGAAATPSAATIGSVAAKAATPLIVFTTAMLSMKQGLDSAASAGKLFALEEENVTAAHRKAAESAGFLTGVLNTLTFGVFSHWIGATGSITSSLAIFLNEWKVLNSAIQAIMIPVKVTYGILMGLWEFTKEVFGGIWEGIKAAIEPLGEAFSYLQVAMNDVWKDLSSAFQPIADALAPFLGEAGDSATIIGTITSALKLLGQGVGFLFKVLGVGMGFIMKAIVPGIKMIIDIFASVTKTIIKVVAPIIEGISRIFTGVVSSIDGFLNIAKGLFSGDGDLIIAGFGKLIKGVLGMFGGLSQVVLQSFVGMFTAIPAIAVNALGKLFSGIGNWLKSIGRLFSVSWVEKIMSWIALPFEWLGSNFAEIGGFITSIGGWISKLSKGNFTGAWSDIASSFGSMLGETLYAIPGKLSQLIINMLSNINTWMEDTIPLYKRGKDAVSAVSNAVTNVVSNAGGAGIGTAYENGGMVAATGQVINNTADWLYSWLPGFATGGLVTGKGLAMVGEAGPEIIIPVKDLNDHAATGKIGVPADPIMSIMPSKNTFDSTVPMSMVPMNNNLMTDRFGKEINRKEITEAIRIRDNVIQKRVHEEKLSSMVSIPVGEERVIASSIKAPSAPMPPGYGVNIPLVRPESGRLMDDVGTRMTRMAVSQARTVGEKASMVQDSHTVGLTPAGSFTSMFDDDGVLRSSEATRARLEPMPLQDIHERIQQEIATSRPEVAEITSQAMEATADHTEKSANTLDEVVSLLKQMLIQLKPGNLSGDSNARSGSTRSNLVAQRSPQYHQLSFGQYGDSAVKGVVNDGV